eukprot:Nk52_evm56s208 gene=Nk52_evmTU56s208
MGFVRKLVELRKSLFFSITFLFVYILIGASQSCAFHQSLFSLEEVDQYSSVSHGKLSFLSAGADYHSVVSIALYEDSLNGKPLMEISRIQSHPHLQISKPLAALTGKAVVQSNHGDDPKCGSDVEGGRACFEGPWKVSLRIFCANDHSNGSLLSRESKLMFPEYNHGNKTVTCGQGKFPYVKGRIGPYFLEPLWMQNKEEWKSEMPMDHDSYLLFRPIQKIFPQVQGDKDEVLGGSTVRNFHRLRKRDAQEETSNSCGTSDSEGLEESVQDSILKRFSEQLQESSPAIASKQNRLENARSLDGSVCKITFVADHKFFQDPNLGQSSNARVLEYVEVLLSRLNSIYRNTVFPQLVQEGDNLHPLDNGRFHFEIGSVLIYENDNSADNPVSTAKLEETIAKYGAEDQESSDKPSAELVLSAFGEHLVNPQGSCLNHLLTGYDLGFILGIALLGTVCVNGNVGLTSFMGQGIPVTAIGGSLVAAHEVGHNLGAVHDFTGADSPCVPDDFEGTDQRFLMWPNVDVNNPREYGDVLSECSIVQIGNRVSFRSSLCFTSPSVARSASCGNGVLEDGEECECVGGFDGNFECRTKDPCCDFAHCKLDVGATCSVQSGPCCDPLSCKPFGPSERVCLEGTECLSAALCSGESAVCPLRQPKSNVPTSLDSASASGSLTDLSPFSYTLCEQNLRICVDDGTCSQLSSCQAYGMSECACQGSPKSTSNTTAVQSGLMRTEDCDLCCFDATLGQCLSTVALADIYAGNMTILATYKPVMTSCDFFVEREGADGVCSGTGLCASSKDNIASTLPVPTNPDDGGNGDQTEDGDAGAGETGNSSSSSDSLTSLELGIIIGGSVLGGALLIGTLTALYRLHKRRKTRAATVSNPSSGEMQEENVNQTYLN